MSTDDRIGDATAADPSRVAAVQWTGLLDTGPEEAFDRLTRLASSLVGAPMVFVSLMDDHRSYWKSVVGADTAESAGDRSVPVGESLCRHVVASGREVIVGDLTGAARTEPASSRRRRGSPAACPP